MSLFEAYIDCEKKSIGLEQLFNLLLVKDADGLPALKTITANDALVSSLVDFRKTNLTIIKTEVKSTPGNILGWNIINPNANAVYVKFYNSSLADVTVGTTIPVLTLMVPANGSVYQEANCVQQIFSTSIVIAATNLISDADTTNVSTPLMINIKYN